MPFGTLLASPFRLLFAGLRWSFHRIDAFLMGIATPFGVNLLRWQDQFIRFLSIYAVLFILAIAPLGWVSFVALAIGYLGVMAVGRAWVANEKIRNDIARKINDGKPDSLPDLRGLALMSGSSLFVLFPLLFMEVQKDFGWFHTTDDVGFLSWFWFTVDKTYLKALPDFSVLYSVHITSIDFAADAGRHLVLFTRLTFDFILIQGLLRLFSIHMTIKDTVRAVKTDTDLVVRLGKRAIPTLVEALNDPVDEVRENAAEVLGQLKDPVIVAPLIAALSQHNRPARKIAEVIGAVGDYRAFPALVAGLDHPDAVTRAHCVTALVEITDYDDSEWECLARIRSRPKVRSSICRTTIRLRSSPGAEWTAKTSFRT